MRENLLRHIGVKLIMKEIKSLKSQAIPKAVI